ncbi:MAG: SurA N-terminal domain-containing protein [Chloroflexota bacterium]|nr:SurA N-terminal domain-containing protein [Chloroflexota bacterium]
MKRLVLSCALLWAILLGCGEPGTSTIERPTSAPPPTLTPAATASVSTPFPATPTTPPVAVVNGQPISMADYQHRVAQFQKALIEQGLDPESEEGKAGLEGVRLQVLEQMIDEVLIEQAAVREGIVIPEEELEAEIQKEIEIAGGRESFEKQLEAGGIKYEDYEEVLRRGMLTLALMERITGAIPTVAEQVHARHILVGMEEEAKEILARLQKGEDFALLAKRHSQDEFTKENGGDLGFFPRGGLIIAPELEEAAFALSPRGRKIVRSEWGYHILEVLEKDTQRPLSPERLNEMRRSRWTQWLYEQREKATIERFLEGE